MKRILKFFIWLLIAIISVVIFFTCWLLLTGISHPPVVKEMSALNIPREQFGKSTFLVGNNWLRKSESGLWEMYIEGDPFDRGVAFGKLTSELLSYQESAFIEQIRKLVPSPGYLNFLKYFTAWFDRNLDKNIPEEYKLEIYGTSFFCSHDYDFIGSGYQRQLNYHAAHDIGHALLGLDLVGCTSFSVWNGKSADSTLIVGRNFDFYMGPKFAENKIVCFYKPSSGYKFMMISWPDMIGVVSGMNEKGLTVTINAARSSIPLQAATPVTILAREILQYSENIAQAYSIALKRKMFVSESILIGSASDNKSAIIEKSPDKIDIVYPDTTQIICTNHFQGEAFRNDRANIENIRGSDSRFRYNRVRELLARKNKIDVPGTVMILRDRFGQGDSDPGMGNPLSINQLIAHHSVVFKPAKKLVWVSTSPYQLGKYVAYDLDKIFKLTPEEIISDHEIYSAELTIPADTFLLSKEYLNFTEFNRMSDLLKQYLNTKESLPSGFEDNYVLSNPRYYLTYSRLADYYSNIKDYKRASGNLKKALSKLIPGADVENKLVKESLELQNRINHADKGN